MATVTSRVQVPAVSAANRYKVPKKQWRRWGDRARRVFNEVFGVMSQQDIFLHPKATPAKRAYWRTTRWNAAWIAAEAANA
jgi:hypothetical protein